MISCRKFTVSAELNAATPSRFMMSGVVVGCAGHAITAMTRSRRPEWPARAQAKSSNSPFP
jgi:hypothetical protein